MRFLSLCAVFLIPAVVVAQSSGSGGSFVVTKEPFKDGIRITADLPASEHKRNTGGLGRSGPGTGDGLCVYTSAWHAAEWQSVTEVYGFRDWMKNYPGGSFPQKFEDTLNQYCKQKQIPVPGYVQHTGGDDTFLELALKTGRMVGVTYCGVDGVGRYGDSVIGHMVNLVMLTDKDACILDNNFPGTWLWMSRADFIARWRGVQANGRPYMARDQFGRPQPIGGGWALAWTFSPPVPYPGNPGTQEQSNACICGNSCKCKEGECPGKCPVVIGQNCPNGKCVLPQQTRLPALPSEGQWVPSGDGKEWGYWKDGKRIAAAFPDGRVESTDANGIATGKIINTPAALPPGVAPKLPVDVAPIADVAPPIGTFPPGGVEPSTLTSDNRWFVYGNQVTKEEAHAALALMDDSSRWNLAVVGEPGFQRTVKDDVAKMAGDISTKLHIQTYAPDAWQVSQFKLTPGVTLRKPAVNRVGADVGTVPTGDYSPVKLVDLLTSDGGPSPRPTPIPSPKPKEPTPPPKVEPIPVPTPMPPPVTPAPQPTPKTPSGGKTLIWLLVLGAIAYYFFGRK